MNPNFINLDVKEFLQREEVELDTSEMQSFVKDRTVLVTGGAGSIGSEICRQVAKYNPDMLVIVDIYENAAYELQQELSRDYPDLNFDIVIASVRDERRIRNIFSNYFPNIVFHAAAHKHVPLMENDPWEAVKNNILGTHIVAKAAAEYVATKFVLISSDKAVNPPNVMGATKRFCEMIIQSMSSLSRCTDYSAVRFGNVLGSNGSVVPLFQKQIMLGGPVTLTHEDVTRYFMTIPEAAKLVLQSSAYAHGGEIFVLDMGEPIKIKSLAENMIKSAGLIPCQDIEIKTVGLRQGEKLYEELLMEGELKPTLHEKIFIAKSRYYNLLELETYIRRLEVAANNENMRDLKRILSQAVPTYTGYKQQF